MTQPTIPVELTDALNAFYASLPGLAEAILQAGLDPETPIGIEEIVNSIINIVGEGVLAGGCIAANYVG
jgi:hypothetical protein